MTKEEFLIELKECLEGQVSSDNLVDTLAYYQSYFSEEEGKGKTEEEIVKYLGSPRLIAHSVIDAEEDGANTKKAYYDVESDSYQEEGSVPMEEKMNNLALKMKMGLGIVLVVIIAAVALNLLIPVVIVLLVIAGIAKLLRKF